MTRHPGWSSPSPAAARRQKMTPKYQQVADALRAEILQGGHDHRLPSEADLVNRFGFARMTIRHAVRQLQSDGLVFAHQGKGVFVQQVASSVAGAGDKGGRARRQADPRAPLTAVSAMLCDLVRQFEPGDPRRGSLARAIGAVEEAVTYTASELAVGSSTITRANPLADQPDHVR